MLAHPAFACAYAAALAGSRTVLDVGYLDSEQTFKSDLSPVTQADRDSHRIICRTLEPYGLDVVSEEGNLSTVTGDNYWLVDPLDGTRDFLSGSNDYTVNVALISQRAVVFGIVVVPAMQTIYYGGEGLGSFVVRNGTVKQIGPRVRTSPLLTVTSRSHDDPIFEQFCSLNHITSVERRGSSLKYCLVAQGLADLAPRFIGSSEWDIAAAQGVIEGAGGLILDLNTGDRMVYGKSRRRNSALIALRAGYFLEEFAFPNFHEGESG